MKYYFTVNELTDIEICQHGLKCGEEDGYLEVYSTIYYAMYTRHPNDIILVELELDEDDVAPTKYYGVFLVKRYIAQNKIVARYQYKN